MDKADWPPVPRGPFNRVIRLYLPKLSAPNENCREPALVQVQ
jgi:hypothetical protein